MIFSKSLTLIKHIETSTEPSASRASDKLHSQTSSNQANVIANNQALQNQLTEFTNAFTEMNKKLARLETLYIMEESIRDTDSGKIKGRVQSDGSWRINGKEHKLMDKMTFQFTSKRSSYKNLPITQVTFKNTHDEIVTTSKIKGYLLTPNHKPAFKFETREVNKKHQKFIPKGQKCIIVLTQPLNLGIRQ